MLYAHNYPFGNNQNKSGFNEEANTKISPSSSKKIKGGFGNMTTYRTFPATGPRLGRADLTNRKLHSGILLNSEVARSF